MSSSPRAALVEALARLRALEVHVEQHPLNYIRWTRPQLDYLARTSRRKMLRTGNRVGKSRVALADVVYRARKTHPWRPDWNARPGPQRQWIVGVSWDQLIPHMRTFHELIGPSELKDAPNYSFRKGWGKDSPCLVWPNGSSVTWKTTEQDERVHAGVELDHVLVDEPCEDETYREMDRRVTSAAGEVSLVLTPINAPGPLEWLQDLAANRVVDDMHYRMVEDVFRFADSGELRRLIDGTVLDAAWIAQQELEVLPKWRDIILHGEWNEIVVDGLFSHIFDPDKHVSDFTLDGTEILAIGFDHGTKAFTETAVLVAVDTRGEYPQVYVIDIYEAPENSPSEADARAVAAMLARHRVKGQALTWQRLKHATGDIAHTGGRKFGRKSNSELAYELAKVLRLKRNEALAPAIWTAKTGRGSDPKGSVRRGLEWIHRAMRRPGHFTIHPRCASLIEAFPKFKGGSEDPAGHLMDGLRYALDPWIAKGQTRKVEAPALRV